MVICYFLDYDINGEGRTSLGTNSVCCVLVNEARGYGRTVTLESDPAMCWAEAEREGSSTGATPPPPLGCQQMSSSRCLLSNFSSCCPAFHIVQVGPPFVFLLGEVEWLVTGLNFVRSVQLFNCSTPRNAYNKYTPEIVCVCVCVRNTS